MKQKLLYIIFTLLFIYSGTIYSQTDNKFWFVAPDITSGHDPNPPYLGGEPIYLLLTSTGNPVEVRIHQPANPAFDTILVNIPAGGTEKLELTSKVNDIENFPFNTVNNKGLYIESKGGDITAYYEVGTVNNPDLFALKGDNALGTEFVIPTQTIWENNTWWYNPDPYHSIHIVATQDNTIIRITPAQDCEGHPAGTPFNIVLDKGQTYCLKASGTLGPEHLSGTKIEVVSGGEIAVTLSDDSIHRASCADQNGDQMIPVDIIGQEYLVMKGEVGTPGGLAELMFITAIEDGTDIYVDGAYKTTINALETYSDTLFKNATYVEASEDIYVYHMAGFSCEMGGAVLPTIEGCTGSHSVSFVRSLPRPFYMNLMTRDGGQYGFDLHYEDGSTFHLPSTWFEQDPISGWWSLKDNNELFTDNRGGGVPANEVVTITNDTLFHIGIINGEHNRGCNYGYFSDYAVATGGAEIISKTYDQNSNLQTLCFGETSTLKATGGYQYEWTPHDYLDDPYSATPTASPPEGTHEYTAKIYRECFPDTNIKVTIVVFPKVEANFAIDKVNGCSPLEVPFENTSIGGNDFRWDLDGNGVFDYTDTVGNDPPLALTTYRNQTNKDTIFRPRLVTTYNGFCPDQITRQIIVYPEIHADFEASDTIGCAPFPVEFTNNSYGGDTNRFKWEFGDGAASADTNPEHMYQNIGDTDSIYEVRLIAETQRYCADTSYQNITVHPYMNVNFAMDTVHACTPIEMLFHNNSVGVDTFWLDFGDGKDTTFADFTSISHTYYNTTDTAIPTTIRLIGNSDQGCTDTLVRQLSVYPRVVANFGNDPVEGCDSVIVNFSDSSIGAGLNYYWSFGDGGSSNNPNPVHRYLNKDISSDTTFYTAQLTVISEHFCKDSQSVDIPIYPFVNAQFSVDTTIGCHPFSIDVVNSSSGAINRYLWDFGDGDTSYTSTTNLPPHIYENTSFFNDTTYTIRLTVENKNKHCVDTFEKNILVYHDIIADFDIDKYESCDPAEFTFSDRSHGAEHYYWNFGDNATSNQETNITHPYEKNNDDTSRVYPVSLFVVSDNNACTDSYDTTLVVHPYIKSLFSVEKYIECPPFQNEFINSSVGGANTYEWFINDSSVSGSPTNDDPFIHVFFNDTLSTNKLYEIKLEADNGECTSIYKDTMAVYPKVTAEYQRDSAGCHPFPVQFNNQSVNAQFFSWSFGDNTTSSRENPQHIYHNYSPSDTRYPVELKASSYHCHDSITKTITVYNKPRAQFEVDKNQGCSPLNIKITNNSISGTEYIYHFDDGNIDTLTSTALVPYTYINKDSNSTNKNYNLTLEVNNAHCSDTLTRTLKVYPEVFASFTPDTNGCSYLTVKFDNQTINASDYEWDFGDGRTSSYIEPEHNFFNNTVYDTTYKVYLKTISPYECWDETTRDVTVYPSPVASFDVSPRYQFYPDTAVTITNGTNTGFWDYKWDFGDGDTSTIKEPNTHHYEGWGTFVITLEVSNEHCYDVYIDTAVINPPVPIPDFTYDGDGCVPLEVTFTNYSLYGEEYEWIFDDGTKSEHENPVHTYYEHGDYHVQLKVTGDGGSRKKFTTIQVYRKPIMKFTSSPDTVMLPEARITTHNLSTYAVKYLWEWGDGDTSTQKTPDHIYGPPPDTSYTITLHGWTEHNCKDSVIHENAVRVRGQGVIEYPNVFMPEQSGPTGGDYSNLDIDNNTVFRPAFKGVIDYNLKIFNRWGELVFETNKLSEGWDGYYKGELCNQGVYIWKVEGKFSTGQPFMKMGDVTLLIGNNN